MPLVSHSLRDEFSGSDARRSEAHDTGHLQAFVHRGAVLRYCALGEGAPIVFLHNAGSSHAIYHPFLEHFSSSHRVLALDLPGYGASETLPFSLDELVTCARAFVEETTRGPVVLVGNCMGSALALLLTQRAPELVSRVIAFNPLSFETFRHGQLAALRQIDRNVPATMATLARVLKTVSAPDAIARFGLAFQLGDTRVRDLPYEAAQLAACYARPGIAHTLHDLLHHIDDFSVIDDLRPTDLARPVCTIWGQENRVLSSRAGEALAHRLGAPITLLPGLGHLPMVESPERCLPLLEAFLSRTTAV